MKKTFGILLGVVLVISVLFVSCSDKKNTASNGKEEVVISIMDIVPSPEREKFFRLMSDKFKEINPHITVEYESTVYEESQNKLTTLGAAKDLPDIVNMHHTYKNQFVPSGWLVDLSDRIERDGIKDQLVPIITDFVWKGDEESLGGIFAMPDGIMTNGCFIRADWLEEANIDIDELRSEWTWDRFFQLAEELTDPEKNRYGYSYRGVDMAAWNTMEMYLSGFTGGYSYDPETGEFLLNTPENAERLEKFIEIYTKGYAPKDSIGWGFAETVDNFTGGLTGMLLNDVEVVATCQDRMEDDEWVILSYPRNPDNDGIYSYVSSVYDYGISAFSEYQDEAWEFLKFITLPENNLIYNKQFTMLPVVKDVGDDPFFGAESPIAGFMDQINYDKFFYYPGSNPANINPISKTIIAEHQKLMQGKITAADFLQIAEEEFESITKKYIEDNPDLTLQKVRQLNQ